MNKKDAVDFVEKIKSAIFHIEMTNRIKYLLKKPRKFLLTIKKGKENQSYHEQ